MIPEKIDRYKIQSEIGHGGMAIVYLAYDPQNKRQVALKVLPREFLGEHQFRERFQREINILTSFNQPGMVPVYGFGQYQEQPYLVMRYMAGGSLEDRLKRVGTFSIAEAAALLGQIAPAIEATHLFGIIHRDLKPSNILFDEAGKPFIADFGIARLEEAAGKSNLTGSIMIGTPAYMSPEQARGGVELDGRSDVYALGVILFELLTGKLPFDADTPMQLAMKHLLEPVPDILAANPNLPRRSKGIISKALAKNPEERYATPLALFRALNEMAQKTPTPAPFLWNETKKSVSWFTRLGGFIRSLVVWPPHKTTWGIGAGILVVGLLFCVWLIRSQLSHTTPSVVLVATSTPTFEKTVTPVFTPASPTPTVTATSLPVVLEQVGIIQNDGDQAVFINTPLPAGNKSLILLIFHQEDSRSNPGFVYASPGSALQLIDVDDQSFHLQVSPKSQLFIETGWYTQTSLQLANTALKFRVAGSCLALDYQPENISLVSCYSGVCAYGVLQGSKGAIPIGQQLAFDGTDLTNSLLQPIPEAEARKWASRLPMGNAAYNCANQYIATPILNTTQHVTLTPSLTPTRTPKPVFIPTATKTPKPRKIPSNTKAPPPTDTKPPAMPTQKPYPLNNADP